jgi:hypothetical protein
MTRTTSALLFLLAAAGCAATGTPRFSERLDPQYQPQDFNEFLSGRDGRVIVVGDPFGMGTDRFASAVVALMPNSREGRTTHFTLTPGPNAHPQARVVLAFNTTSSANLCAVTPASATAAPAAAPAAAPTTGGEIVLHMGWCLDGKGAPQSEIIGRLAGARGIDDEGFRKMIASATDYLFPRKNYHDETRTDEP